MFTSKEPSKKRESVVLKPFDKNSKKLCLALNSSPFFEVLLSH